MSTITISISDLHPGSIPPSLQGIISQDVWAQLCHSINGAQAQAHCYSCFGEVLICLCCVFPFIFLCHPCFYMAWNQSLSTTEINRLNRAFFGGARVLEFANGALTVNTSFLMSARQMQMPMSTVPAPVYISQPQPVSYPSATPVSYPTATPVSVPSNKTTGAPTVHDLNYSAVPSAQPVTVSAQVYQPQQQRMMYVTVPQNAVAGQILTCAAPTGQMVQVTLPPGASPGQNLMVYY